jgi:hypothetical protein
MAAIKYDFSLGRHELVMYIACLEIVVFMINDIRCNVE